MIKCTIIGKFAYDYKILDGQTVKCKTIEDALKDKFGAKEINTIDTYKWKRHPLNLVKKCVSAIKNSENIITMPAHNGVKVFVPLLSIINKIYNRKLHYIVIGSWLYNKIKDKKLLINQLKSFDAIYVETTNLKDKLELIGLNNVIKMNNYKNININNNIPSFTDKDVMQICTFSRVNYKKGIEALIKVINEINQNEVKFHLDIYGQVDKEYNEKFNNIIAKSKAFIKYKGVIDSNKSVDVIKEYDMLIFPTKYYTEGIPGTIIDAYAAGIPVISSDWENSKDVVENSKTGLVYKFDDNEDLKNKLVYVYDNQKRVYNMRSNCINRAKEYCCIDALNVLFDKMR